MQQFRMGGLHNEHCFGLDVQNKAVSMTVSSKQLAQTKIDVDHLNNKPSTI